MVFSKALTHLYDGQNIRRTSWPEDEFLQFDFKQITKIFPNLTEESWTPNSEDFTIDEWELYGE